MKEIKLETGKERGGGRSTADTSNMPNATTKCLRCAMCLILPFFYRSIFPSYKIISCLFLRTVLYIVRHNPRWRCWKSWEAKPALFSSRLFVQSPTSPLPRLENHFPSLNLRHDDLLATAVTGTYNLPQFPPAPTNIRLKIYSLHTTPATPR